MRRDLQPACESIEVDRWENEGGRCLAVIHSSTDASSSSLCQENESLHRALVGMSRGLLQYASQCQLFAPVNDRGRSTLLNSLAVQQQESMQQLSEFLDERQRPIQWGVFPADFTRYNYVALDFLWPRIADFQAQLVRMLDTARTELENDRQATDVLDDVIQSEREILAELVLACPTPGTRQQLARTRYAKRLDHAATVTANGRAFRSNGRSRIGPDAKVKRGSSLLHNSIARGASHAS